MSHSSRRQFLSKAVKTGLFLSAASMMSFHLAACTDEDETDGPVALPSDYNDMPKLSGYTGKVAIIGAGMSGLYAASLLEKAGVDFTIYEATGILGGRIKTMTDWGHPIELGAEEVHGGQNNRWFELLKNQGYTPTKNDGGTDYVLLGNQALSEEQALAADEDLRKLTQWVSNLDDYAGAEQSVASWLQSKGVPARLLAIAEQKLANEDGTSNTLLSALGQSKKNRAWLFGDDNYAVTGPGYSQILTEIFSRVTGRIVYNAPVQEIDYSGPRVTLKLQGKPDAQADFVLVTTSLGVLKSGMISFTPALPAAHQSAIQKIGFGRGSKVIVRFPQDIWEGDAGSIVGGTRTACEYWTHANQPGVLTAFAMGDYSGKYNSVTESIQGVIDDLAPFWSGEPRPESSGVRIQDWDTEPYVKGSYSFAALGEGNARADLSAVIDNKLAFAGEALAPYGAFGTVQGAIEAARMALVRRFGKA